MLFNKMHPGGRAVPQVNIRISKSEFLWRVASSVRDRPRADAALPRCRSKPLFGWPVVCWALSAPDSGEGILLQNASRPDGFTLVELLVVLSILALLGALAVPALQAALERADRTVCLSNLRQIGQAMSEFVADRGHYPAAEVEIRDSTGSVVERKRWYHALAPYLGAPARAWSSGQGRASIDPETGRATGFVLPSEDDRDQDVLPRVFRCPRCKGWEIGRNGSYGYNHQYLGDAREVVGSDGELHARRYPVAPNDLLDRANTIVIVDSMGTGDGPYRRGDRPDASALGNHGFTVDPPRLPSRFGSSWGSDGELAGVGDPVLPSRPAIRHRGGVCCLFGDSRVEWLPIQELTRDDGWFNGTGRPTAVSR